MKTCSRCKEPKALEHFHKRQSSKDGRTPACKPCIAKRRKDIATGVAESSAGPHLTPEQKKDIYTSVIVRMREIGLTTDFTTNEMLERVGAL